MRFLSPHIAALLGQHPEADAFALLLSLLLTAKQRIATPGVLENYEIYEDPRRH